VLEEGAMTIKHDGGSAFPQVETEKHYTTDPDVRSTGGMSLRDYFAAKVLASWIVAAPTLDAENEAHRDHLSSLAYAQADSMLKARAK
jgi:hypothetical protein